MNKPNHHEEMSIIVPSLSFQWSTVRKLDIHLKKFLEQGSEEDNGYSSPALLIEAYQTFIHTLKFEVMLNLENRFQTRNVVKAKIECKRMISIAELGLDMIFCHILLQSSHMAEEDWTSEDESLLII